MSGLSDVDLDRIEAEAMDPDSGWWESEGGVDDFMALVAEVRRLRDRVSHLEAVAEIVNDEVELLRRERGEAQDAADRFFDTIRRHRESTVTELTCCQDCRDAGKRPWLPERDRDLYAALDQEDDRG